MHTDDRMSAAYRTFKQKNLPRLKEEMPNTALSQLYQMLKKDWPKSPENPLNKLSALEGSYRSSFVIQK